MKRRFYFWTHFFPFFFGIKHAQPRQRECADWRMERLAVGSPTQPGAAPAPAAGPSPPPPRPAAPGRRPAPLPRTAMPAPRPPAAATPAAGHGPGQTMGSAPQRERPRTRRKHDTRKLKARSVEVLLGGSRGEIETFKKKQSEFSFF